MAKTDTLSTSNSELQDMVPDALRVIRETITQDFSFREDGDSKGWPKDALNTSIWLVEKVTGKAKTEDFGSGDGMLRQLLQMFNDRKANEEAALESSKQIIDTNTIGLDTEIHEPLDEIDQFVKDFGSK